MNILKHTGQNIGGVNALNFAFHNHFESFSTDLFTMQVSYELSIGHQWYYMYGSPDTISIEEVEENTQAGLKYVYKIKLSVPKDSQVITKTLFSIAEKGIIIKAMNKNGEVRVYGTVDFPCRLLTKTRWPGSVGEFNGYEFVFHCELPHPAGYDDSRTYPFLPPDEEPAPPT